MELSPGYFQIIVSAVLIIGAAGVVILFERLRVRNSELRETLAAIRSWKPIQSRSVLKDAKLPLVVSKRKRMLEPPVLAAARVATAVPETAKVVEKDVAPAAQNDKEALSKWLTDRAAIRVTHQAATENESAPVSEPVVEAPTPFLLDARPESVVVDASLFEALIASSNRHVSRPIPKTPVNEEAQRARQLLAGELAPGMHESASLAKLVESRKPFAGLVVSIGVNEPDGRSIQDADLKRSIAGLIGTLLGPDDFGFQVSPDEFLLLCPGQEGAEAQRRLSEVSERLWDFQLRALGTFPILFNLGGTDIHHEPLAEAIVSATERMFQTRRSRKAVGMDSASQRRKIV